MVSVRNQVGATTSIMSILNENIVTEPDKKEALKAMGLSSCQVACITREIPSAYPGSH